MKTKSYIFLALILAIGFQSCSEFLTVKPRNKRIVKTTSDHKAILAGYMQWLNVPTFDERPAVGYGFHFQSSYKMSVYCGETNLKENTLSDPKTGELSGRAESTLRWLEKNSAKWEQNYQFIGYLNYIIGNIDDVQDNHKITPEENWATRNYVKGEALVWRAWSFYNIMQFYAPYLDNKYGIPINLDAYEDPVSVVMKRNTQSEGYQQILSDCQDALDLLEETPTNPWNTIYKEDFIHALMANIYMFKAMSGASESTDWANAEAYATKAIGDRVLSNESANLRKMFDMSKVHNGVYNSSQFFARFIKTTNSFGEFREVGYVGTATFEGVAIPEIVHSYKEEDIRKSVYFDNSMTGRYDNNKYNFAEFSGQNSLPAGGIVVPFRLAEMYLIKAEALCRQNKDAAAISVLNTFKENRYIPYDSGEIGQSHEEILEEILHERKLEFFHESDVRWLDMKRLGLEFDRGTIVGIKMKLEANDFRYAWPIPIEEIHDKSDVVQNPGWEYIIFE